MNDVFLDTVGLLALLNRSDQWRTAALAAFESLKANRREFVTTDLILFEAGNALARTSLREAIADLRDELRDRGKIVGATVAECERAWQLFRRGEAGHASIVDCVSLEIMRRLGITDAFTNDQHFAAAGFNTLF